MTEAGIMRQGRVKPRRLPDPAGTVVGLLSILVPLSLWGYGRCGRLQIPIFGHVACIPGRALAATLFCIFAMPGAGSDDSRSWHR